jgi:hypothetical protein
MLMSKWSFSKHPGPRPPKRWPFHPGLVELGLDQGDGDD